MRTTTLRILNVGCGGETYGNHRLDTFRHPGTTEIGSAVALPYRDGVFDEVYAGNLLEHLPNPLLFLQEAARVLRQRGRLICITDHAGYMGYHLIGFHAVDNHRWTGPRGDRHYMLFNPSHLRNLAEAAGFEVIRLEFFSKWKPGVLARIVSLWARPLAMPNLRIEAVKANRESPTPELEGNCRSQNSRARVESFQRREGWSSGVS